MSIFSALKPEADLSRNGFHMGHRDVFSGKTGMLMSSFFQETIPDSVYEVSVLSLLRTLPIQSAPFARMKVNYEYYFVPFSQIWSGFNKFYYERGDNLTNPSNIQNPTDSDIVPNFDLSQLVLSLWQFQLLLYTQQWIANYDVNNGGSSNLDYWIRVYQIGSTLYGYYDVHNRPCCEDALRILDLAGYGNYLPMGKYYALQYLNEPVSANDPTKKGDKLAADILAIDPDSYSSWDLYCQAVAGQYLDGFIIGFSTPQVITNLGGRKPNIFRLASLLKIWSDYYRNSQYDVSNYAYYYNFDYVVSGGMATISTAKVLEIIKPRYRQYKKDVFTGSFPNAQFGSVAVAQLENPSTIFSVTPPDSGKVRNVFVDSSAQLVQSVSVTSGDDSNRYATGVRGFTIDSSVSALAVREALAIQKYRETILRAGNRLTALQRAIFGDNSRYLANQYVDFIGSHDMQIDFNSVAATAEGNGVNVGELASNGVGTGANKAFTYHAHDFGILIGVVYILPESEYNTFGFDPQVIKSESFDFYKPHFQNLGLSPVYNFLLNPQAGVIDAVYGYSANYWEYKTCIDHVHGEFYSNLPCPKDYLPQDVKDMEVYNALSKGVFANYVTPRITLHPATLLLQSLYVEPTSVDNIFYQVSDPFQSSDQFKFNVYHDVKAVLPMSVVGLPS